MQWRILGRLIHVKTLFSSECIVKEVHTGENAIDPPTLSP